MWQTSKADRRRNPFSGRNLFRVFLLLAICFGLMSASTWAEGPGEMRTQSNRSHDGPSAITEDGEPINSRAPTVELEITEEGDPISSDWLDQAPGMKAGASYWFDRVLKLLGITDDGDPLNRADKRESTAMRRCLLPTGPPVRG